MSSVIGRGGGRSIAEGTGKGWSDLPERTPRRKTAPRGYESAVVTVEVVIAAMLLGIAAIGIAGLLSLALSTWTTGESSAIATSLARAEMDELLSDVPTLTERDGTVRVTQVPKEEGRTYTLLTCVDGSQPHRLDVAVKVSWQVAYGSCAGTPSEPSCAGHRTTLTRTIRTQLTTASPPTRGSRCS